MTDRSDDQARAAARAAKTIPALLSSLAPGSDVRPADQALRGLDQVPRLDELLAELRAAYGQARRQHRQLRSTREGIALLAEAVEDAWRAIRADDDAATRAAVVETATTALRFLVDLYNRRPEG